MYHLLCLESTQRTVNALQDVKQSNWVRANTYLKTWASSRTKRQLTQCNLLSKGRLKNFLLDDLSQISHVLLSTSFGCTFIFLYMLLILIARSQVVLFTFNGGPPTKFAFICQFCKLHSIFFWQVFYLARNSLQLSRTYWRWYTSELNWRIPTLFLGVHTSYYYLRS